MEWGNDSHTNSSSSSGDSSNSWQGWASSAHSSAEAATGAASTVAITKRQESNGAIYRQTGCSTASDAAVNGQTNRNNRFRAVLLRLLRGSQRLFSSTFGAAGVTIRSSSACLSRSSSKDSLLSNVHPSAAPPTLRRRRRQELQQPQLMGGCSILKIQQQQVETPPQQQLPHHAVSSYLYVEQQPQDAGTAAASCASAPSPVWMSCWGLLCRGVSSSSNSGEKENFLVRALWTVILVLLFFLIIAAGHVYCALLVITLVALMYREITAVKRCREDPRMFYDFTALKWYFFVITIVGLLLPPAFQMPWIVPYYAPLSNDGEEKTAESANSLAIFSSFEQQQQLLAQRYHGAPRLTGQPEQLLQTESMNLTSQKQQREHIKEIERQTAEVEAAAALSGSRRELGNAPAAAGYSRVYRVFSAVHELVFYFLFFLGFVCFVLSLRRNALRRQFSQFGVALLALLFVVAQALTQIANVFAGLAWFLLPCALVILNDVAAYVCGKLFGRTPLTPLSPKKTREGFLGACVATIFFALIAPPFMQKSEVLTAKPHAIDLRPFAIWRTSSVSSSVNDSLCAAVSYDSTIPDASDRVQQQQQTGYDEEIRCRGAEPDEGETEKLLLQSGSRVAIVETNTPQQWKLHAEKNNEMKEREEDQHHFQGKLELPKEAALACRRQQQQQEQWESEHRVYRRRCFDDDIFALFRFSNPLAAALNLPADLQHPTKQLCPERDEALDIEGRDARLQCKSLQQPQHHGQKNTLSSVKEFPFFTERPASISQSRSAVLARTTGAASSCHFFVSPFQLHALVIGVFVAFFAPFGGFFASGFKRAARVKDFGEVIPGHGGVTDRFDCQIITGMFTHLYYKSFVHEESPSNLVVLPAATPVPVSPQNAASATGPSSIDPAATLQRQKQTSARNGGLGDNYEPSAAESAAAASADKLQQKQLQHQQRRRCRPRKEEGTAIPSRDAAATGPTAAGVPRGNSPVDVLGFDEQKLAQHQERFAAKLQSGGRREQDISECSAHVTDAATARSRDSGKMQQQLLHLSSNIGRTSRTEAEKRKLERVPNLPSVEEVLDGIAALDDVQDLQRISQLAFTKLAMLQQPEIQQQQ